MKPTISTCKSRVFLLSQTSSLQLNFLCWRKHSITALYKVADANHCEHSPSQVPQALSTTEPRPRLCCKSLGDIGNSAGSAIVCSSSVQSMLARSLGRGVGCVCCPCTVSMESHHVAQAALRWFCVTLTPWLHKSWHFRCSICINTDSVLLIIERSVKYFCGYWRIF